MNFTRILIFCLVAFIISCGKNHSSVKSIAEKLELVADKSDKYVQLVSQHQDTYGFILTEKCDALLFSGLLSAARPDLQIDITAAQDSELNWHRRPSQDCGPSYGNSRSSISRDMMLGLFWHIWRHKDLDLAVELMDYLKDRLYYMGGEGSAGELFMTPPYMNTLAEMIRKLGGPKYTLELSFPARFSDDGGYVAHLVTWHILLRGEIFGSIDEHSADILAKHVDREPKNPLFQAAYHKYTDGNQSAAVELLLNSAEWPDDRLPSTDEHCDEWPIQRDYTSKDWGSCEPYKEHTGAELVAIYELILRS